MRAGGAEVGLNNQSGREDIARTRQAGAPVRAPDEGGLVVNHRQLDR
jgi:hypothetical protein